MENIIISNQSNFDEIKSTLAKAGADKCHVLVDFDRTLTKFMVNGKKVSSQISVLRDGDYLTPDYREKAHQLFDKNHPIEVDPDIPLDKKKSAMRKWWTEHFDLLIETGLDKKDIESVAKHPSIKFREGVAEFIKFLEARNIPLVIMSASGVGDVIDIMFEKHNLLSDNVHIITNHFNFDEDGKATGVQEPIIHALNKDETAITDYPPYQAIKNRKNVILIGDGMGDLGMAEGFDYDNLLTIGFLNSEVEKNLENYKNSFDIVITDDGNFDAINDLVKEVYA